MRQSVNIFSKLFSSTIPDKQSPDHTKHIEHLKSLFIDKAEFFIDVPVFNQQKTHFIKHMMIHPDAGLILFHFFDHEADTLKGVTASAASQDDANADIKTDDTKSFLMQRFDEIFHTQLAPIRSILICTSLNEGEFDALDKSFHSLIPKDSALFNDNDDERYKKVIFAHSDKIYDLTKIKKALFPQLVISKTHSLMNKEQENIINFDIQERLLVKGHPGSGKSSTLIAKALYEKMKDKNLNLIILGKGACNVHRLQALIFSFIENSHWGLNPADIVVSSFETIRRRCSEKEKYDLIICDDINENDLKYLKTLLHKKGRLLASSHYNMAYFKTLPTTKNYRLSPALCAACEGLKVDNLKNSLSFLSGNVFMNTILTVASLLKEVSADEITIVHINKEQLIKLQVEIDDYFEPITYLYDDVSDQKGMGLYPISHLPCLLNKYMIIIIDDESEYDPIELISRAQVKSFILSESKEVYNIINQIQGIQNELI